MGDSFDISHELDALEVDNFENQAFIPVNRLEQLLSQDIVASLIYKSQVKFYDRYKAIQVILEKGLKVLAILATIRKISAISRFIELDQSSGGFLDGSLPLSEAALASIFPSEDVRRKFFRKQWRFLAPVLTADQSYRIFHEKTILPFTSAEPVTSGGYGDLYLVTVDPSHHNVPSKTAQLDLICKEVVRNRDESTLKEDYDNERHVLSSLRCLNHPSIIKLITAYSRGPRYSFLFPVADGDLKHFLSLEKLPSPFQSHQDIFEALWSLSSALEAVHNYFFDEFSIRQIGCHYDIKPGNILYLNGRFILADFGLSRLRNVDESSRSLFKGVEGSYIAPECEPADQDFQRANVGRASDIWSLGCFLFETLAYMDGGPTAVDRLFRGRRVKLGPHFAYYFHAGDRVNPPVAEYLQGFATPEYGRTKLGALAVMTRIMLAVDPLRRPKVSWVTLSMFHIAHKSTFDTIYSLLEGQPGSFDLELEVERVRLRIWGQAMGFSYEYSHLPSTAWLSTPHSHDELQKVQEILKRCHKELLLIRGENDQDRPFTYNRYYHLQRLQDELWAMLPSRLRLKMSSQVEDELLSLNGDTLLENIQIMSEEPTLSCTSLDGTQSSSWSQHRRVMLLALMKKISSAMEHQEHEQQDLMLHKEALEQPYIPFNCHCLTRTKGGTERLLVERMKYKESWYSRIDELLERINAIASLRTNPRIKDVFPVLEGKGYYHDVTNHEFHIIYKLPSLAKDINPKSLHSIMGECRSRSDRPSLTQKFDLAIMLVNSVLNFHKAGWVHKNICSFNLVCFPEAFSPPIASISAPWIIGFNYSRLNTKTAFTEGPGYERSFKEYQHPEYLKQVDNPQEPSIRFRSEFDYYSVGLVLLEIACWKPLQRITKEIRGSPEDMVEKLLKDEIPVVKTYMGDPYGEAVEACLACYSEGPEDPDEARRKFEMLVCTPISHRLI